MKVMHVRQFGMSAGLAVIGGLVLALPSQAALVAHYTFDNADTIINGDGSPGYPFAIQVNDVSGNGNHAGCGATQEQNPAGSGVFGCQMLIGQPGLFGESHKFSRDPSDFNLDSANGVYTVAPGVVPTGAAPRTFALWFSQEVDVTAGGSQDKLFGYGTNVAGQAFDVSLEGGGIRIRHFGGNITYGSGFDFQATGADAGFHHLMVRVNNGASTFADVDVFLDGVQLAISAQAGAGTSQVINTVDAAAVSGFPNYGFGIGSSTERAGGSSQNGFQGWIDDFQIFDTAEPIPEPASLVLLGFGGLAMLQRKA